jgi:hypothetical protein
MQYKYRWWLLLAMMGLFSIGIYCYVILPSMSRLVELKATEKKLREELIQLRRLAKLPAVLAQAGPALPPRGQVDLVSDLLAEVQVSGLIVQSARVLSQETDDEVKLKLELQGGFKQISTLIFLLGKLAYPMGVLDFSYDVPASGLPHFSANIVILKHRLSRQESLATEVLPEMSDPFCVAGVLPSRAAEEHAIKWQAFPVAMIKMVGSFEQGQHKQALLWQPNNDVLAVEVGSLVGRERARVRAIEEDSLDLVLPDGRRVRLSM